MNFNIQILPAFQEFSWQQSNSYHTFLMDEKCPNLNSTPVERSTGWSIGLKENLKEKVILFQ